jgi:hypothetical protein
MEYASVGIKMERFIGSAITKRVTV